MKMGKLVTYRSANTSSQDVGGENVAALFWTSDDAHG